MVDKKIIELSKDNCLYLESLNLDYKDMMQLIGVKITEQRLRKIFSNYEIKHKTKAERVALKLNDDYRNRTIGFLIQKFNCSYSTIVKALKIYDKNNNEN